MRKKLDKMLIAVVVSFALLFFSVDANAKNKWFMQREDNWNIYSFGKNWYDGSLRHPLAGRMWVYSGQTFGWSFERNLNIYDQNFLVKVKYSAKITKGKGTLKSYSLFRTENDYGFDDIKRTNSWTNSAYTFEQFFLIDNGTVKAKCPKGCTVSLTIKYTINKQKKKWNKYNFKIKVKPKRKL